MVAHSGQEVMRTTGSAVKLSRRVTAVFTGDTGASATPPPVGAHTPARGWKSSSAQPSNQGRRLFLIGAASVALGGGGLAALLTMRDQQPALTRLLLATGPKGAVYVEVGSDIAQAVQAYSPGTHVEVLSTAATVENLRMLGTREADLGFASLDAAAVDSRVRQKVITALTRVYDSSLHLVVPAESPIQNLRDLTGTRVSIGGEGSGTEFTATRLLTVAGIIPAEQVRLGQTPSMNALESGTIDAVFSLTGCPTPAIADLASRRRIRLVPLAEYFGDLDRAIPRAYAPAPIIEGTYQGVKAVDTVLVPNVLLARPDLPDAAVTLVMDALFASRSRRFWVHPDSKRISLDMATVTGAATLHPRAKSWLDQHMGE
jgi:TRAP transporter TAXI family solute receptor